MPAICWIHLSTSQQIALCIENFISVHSEAICRAQLDSRREIPLDPVCVGHNWTKYFSSEKEERWCISEAICFLTYLEPTVEPEPSNPDQLWLEGLYGHKHLRLYFQENDFTLMGFRVLKLLQFVTSIWEHLFMHGLEVEGREITYPFEYSLIQVIYCWIVSRH